MGLDTRTSASRIRPQLRSLHSPDAYDLEHYQPEDAETFGFLVQAMIGSYDDHVEYFDQGEESFDFLVCSPLWLRARMREEGTRSLFGRHYVFLLHYDYSLLWNTLQDLCNGVKGGTWEVVASELGRYGKWEFEDYVPWQPLDKETSSTS